MDDITDVKTLENRIYAALDRIEGNAGGGAVSAPSDAAVLETQLDEERAANAQLEERVRALKERQDTKIAGLEAQLATQRSQMIAMDSQVQRLRETSEILQSTSAALRAATRDNAIDADKINAALSAELDAVVAQRASEAAEVDALLAALKPLISEDVDAAG